MKDFIIISEPLYLPMEKLMNHFRFFAIETKSNESHFLSPFSNDPLPKFRVYNPLNIAFDYSIMERFTVTDLAEKLLNCTVEEIGGILKMIDFSNIQQAVKVLEAKPIKSQELTKYLFSVCTKYSIVSKYILEVQFQLNDKIKSALAFTNNSGGFELFSSDFSGFALPSDYTLIYNNSESLCIFSTSDDFLSYFGSEFEMSGSFDFLILNSEGFIERSKLVYGRYRHIYIFLNKINSSGSIKKIQGFCESGKCIDKSNEYLGFEKQKQVEDNDQEQFEDENENLLNYQSRGINM
jgi:hypothetical protein